MKIAPTLKNVIFIEGDMGKKETCCNSVIHICHPVELTNLYYQSALLEVDKQNTLNNFWEGYNTQIKFPLSWLMDLVLIRGTAWKQLSSQMVYFSNGSA